MDKVIIGLAGKAHSGKSTVADCLVGFEGAMHYAFADILKSIIAEYYHVDCEQLWCSTKTPEVRKLLQGTGDMLRTYRGDNFFIDEVFKQIDDSNDHLICIRDVRYLNEAEAIKSRGGYLVNIVRPTATPIEYNPNHESETGLDGYDGFDAVIMNDGSIRDMCVNMRDILKNIVFY